MTRKNDIARYRGFLAGDGEPYRDLVHLHDRLIEELNKARKD
jgi:hypothetical protein